MKFGVVSLGGLDRHLFHMDNGALPQEHLFESLELLATEVLPMLDWSPAR